MKLNTQTPKLVLNKAFLKQRPLRSEIENFKTNLKTLLAKVEARESDPKIRVEEFRNLPIKQIIPEEQQPFIKLVDEILEQKKLGQETAALESEIDAMVYQLYELMADEIAIVEGK